MRKPEHGRCRLHRAQGGRGAARGRRGQPRGGADLAHLHRDQGAGVGPYRLDRLQGRRHRAPKRQLGDRGARDGFDERNDVHAEVEALGVVVLRNLVRRDLEILHEEVGVAVFKRGKETAEVVVVRAAADVVADRFVGEIREQAGLHFIRLAEDRNIDAVGELEAIDRIDEAGSRLRIRRMTAPPELREFDDRIANVRREKESAIDGQDFEKAASLRDKEKSLIAEKADREKSWKAGDLDVVAEVDEELIAEVLSTATGIPVFKLTEAETARLLRMEDELHRRVIGQNQAIKALSQAIRRTRAGLKDPRRPGGSFIFAGPSGVGKTELSRTLASFLFGDEDALIQLDMSEYSEKHTASRLFGAPPGYVGYDEGGQLTEKVRRRPFSVVLFDEIEKAHPDIFNSLLQVLEDGRLTDAQGRVVDFKNTVIIMTTNLGTRDISKSLSLGFMNSADALGNYERMKAKVSDELKTHFRPEFLNRIDDIIVFHQLSENEIVQIVDLMVANLENRLKEKDMGIELTAAAKAILAQRGYDPVLGARPLRRTIQREIEDALSEKILFGDIKAGHIIVIDFDESSESFTFVGSPRADLPDTPGDLAEAPAK